jgi:hypothetical protein
MKAHDEKLLLILNADSSTLKFAVFNSRPALTRTFSGVVDPIGSAQTAFTRLLDIPGGEQIVKESDAQMRKFNCWNISIVQQYSRFKESRIRSAVFGNSRQFFLMRQNDRADLEDMGHDIGLTELTKHAILSYPLPDQQSGEKFAAFTYLHSDAQNPICGTVHNVVSPEMLYISGSSGAKFDERARGLRGSEDVISAIQAASE